jgi:hypothetical protein
MPWCKYVHLTRTRENVDYDTDTKKLGAENDPVRSIAVTVVQSAGVSPPIHTV